MRITQGTFSFLPDLTDEQIRRQVAYALGCGWSISLEHTDDPHPRNAYWEMFGLPMFEPEANDVLDALFDARKQFPNEYLKINAYDARLGRQTTALSFIVQRPPHEPGFRLERQAGPDRAIRYQLHAYATDSAAGERYHKGSNGVK